MDELSIKEQRHYWTGILIRAQETLAESIGQPRAYFKADQEIRQARRELRRLEKKGQVMTTHTIASTGEDGAITCAYEDHAALAGRGRS